MINGDWLSRSLFTINQLIFIIKCKIALNFIQKFVIMASTQIYSYIYSIYKRHYTIKKNKTLDGCLIEFIDLLFRYVQKQLDNIYLIHWEIQFLSLSLCVYKNCTQYSKMKQTCIVTVVIVICHVFILSFFDSSPNKQKSKCKKCWNKFGKRNECGLLIQILSTFLVWTRNS